MLLKKKILKILSVLVAVIIAFCSFTISASAASIDDFIFDIGMAVAIFDDSGNLIDETVLSSEDIKYNSIKDFYYVDAPAPAGHKFFEPDTLTFLFCSAPDLEANAYVFSFAHGVSVDYSMSENISLIDGFTVGSIGYVLNSSGLPSGNFNSSNFVLNSSKELSILSFAFAPAIIEDSSDGPKLLGPKLQPGMFDFYSNINTFFKQSVSWFSSIFSKVVLQPSLTVLVLGFIAVGFVFGLLHRLIRSH